MQIVEIVELILSGCLGTYFYINSLMTIILIAFLMAPVQKAVKFFTGAVICFEIYVSCSLANHFLCLEDPGEIIEAFAALTLLHMCGGFIMFLCGRLLYRIYIYLKFKNYDGNNNQAD